MVSPLLKEWCVVAPLMLHQFATGIILAFPAVLKPALTNGTDIHASGDEASWIAASYSMTGGFGFLFLPFLMQSYGRRFINIIINLIVIIGWLIIALSPNVATLIAGRALQGLAFGSLYICGIITAEYSHPKRRGFFIAIKQAGTGFGELFCHGFGFALTWRQVAWLGIIPPVIAAVATLMWQESPSWLAYKERYEECAITFEWLRGRDAESKREIKKLILAQQNMKHAKVKGQGSIARVMTSLRTAAFIKPFRVLFVSLVMIHICGRHFFQAEITQIMVSLTEDRSRAYYFTILFDCMKIFALIVSSYVIRKLKRRTLLFCAGYVACFFLGSFCLVDLLVSQQMLTIKWLAPLLLILFNIACYVGVIPLVMVLKGELIPLEYKGLGVTLVGISSAICSTVLMKLTAKLLELIKPRGTFGIYILLVLGCLLYLNYLLPETKDRTLQDIELQFMDLKTRNDIENAEFTGELINSLSKKDKTNELTLQDKELQFMDLKTRNDIENAEFTGELVNSLKKTKQMT